MGLFNKVGSFLRREAKDLGDAAEDVKDKFDRELSKREHELEMTPAEKIAALQQQGSVTDAKFDQIANKTGGRGALADAVAEVGQLPNDPSLPNIAHIVVPDGRVGSGNEVDQIVDASGIVHDVPVIEAPTAEDLQKSDTPLPAPPVPEPSIPVVDDLPPPPTAGDPGEKLPATPPAPELVDPPAPPTAPLPDAPDQRDVPDEPDAADEPGAADVLTADDLGEDLPPPPALVSAAATEAAVETAETTDTVPSLLDPSNPTFGKTPAQLRYERARAAANDLLDELRGELKDDGEI